MTKMTKKSEIVYSCPFCGSTRVEICRTNDNACWVRCSMCGSDAESDKTRDGALGNWNRRSLLITIAEITEDQDLEWNSQSREREHVYE